MYQVKLTRLGVLICNESLTASVAFDTICVFYGVFLVVTLAAESQFSLAAEKDLQKALVSRGKRLPTFCIVVPIFNQEKKVEPALERLVRHLSGLDIKTAIFAVDDGSTDNTRAVLQNVAAASTLIKIVNCRHDGYGAANRAGFRAAINCGFDYVLVMDVNSIPDAHFIEQFFRPMILSFDFIKASRYSQHSCIEGGSALDIWLSDAANRVAGYVLRLPITDYTTGCRAIKSTLLARMMTKETGFGILMEELVQARRLGAKFYEVPFVGTLHYEKRGLAGFGRFFKQLFFCR